MAANTMPYRREGPKIGRNDPCPCGSGQKFKRCHYSAKFELPYLVQRARIEKDIEEKARQLLEEHKAREFQRQQQQGLGRPIISIEHMGYRFIAVKNRLYYSKKWKTFADFLNEYMGSVLGGEWGNAELKKPLETRHPILQWYYHICILQRQYIQKPGEIASMPTTGAVAAYYGLAYSLYLIAHNVHDIESRLIQRLKNPENFQGALYETRVAAELIRAGFELEFENEDDRSTTHCEFTATYTRTGRKFSAEAKSRPPALHGKGKQLRVQRQLHGALKKKAKYQRLVFIDINRPFGSTREEIVANFDRAIAIVKRSETMLIDGAPAPAAYICLTNYPDQYSLDAVPNWLGGRVLLGYKIADFGYGKQFESIRAAVRAREKHIELFDFEKSIIEHSVFPSTFDGQLPSTTFGDGKVPRLLIGQRYLVPDANGKEIPGVLEDAVVLTNESRAYGIYKLDNGKRVWATSELTPKELEDYRRHPDTFFGVYKKVPKGIDGPIEMFDFLYDSYKDTPRERLLELIKDFPDFENFKDLSHKDLAEAVCERWAYNATAGATKKK
jgi:hypothetical protein